MIAVNAYDPQCTVAVYEDMESALKELIPILGEPKDTKDGKRWDFGHTRADEDAWNLKMETYIFKNYYAGCGFPGCIIAEEITVKPLKTASWDLD